MPVIKPKKKRQLSSSSEEETTPIPAASKFKAKSSNRKIIKVTEPAKDDGVAQKMDDLIKSQILKFKPAKKKKWLNSPKTGKMTIKGTGRKLVEQQNDPREEPLRKIFEPAAQSYPVAKAMALADIDPEGKNSKKIVENANWPLPQLFPNAMQDRLPLQLFKWLAMLNSFSFLNNPSEQQHFHFPSTEFKPESISSNSSTSSCTSTDSSDLDSFDHEVE